MKKETLEEAAESRFGTDMDSIRGGPVYDLNADSKRGFVAGAKSDAARDYWYAKWQQEQDKNKYSKEEVINFLEKREDYLGTEPSIIDYLDNREWFEQFKKGIKD